MKYISTLRVHLLGNAVYDNMWCTHKRPEKLVMRHNNCDLGAGGQEGSPGAEKPARAQADESRMGGG